MKRSRASLPEPATLDDFLPAIDLVGRTAAWSARLAQGLRDGAARKADASPVTAVDLAIQAIVVASIRARFGADAAFVGEESTAVFEAEGGRELRAAVHALVRSFEPSLREGLDSAAIDAAIDAGQGGGLDREHWIVDPIDGTRGFLRDGQYCVCLAFVRDREVVFGAAGCPRLGANGRLVAAVRGHGAWSWQGCERAGEPGRIRRSSIANPAGAPLEQLITCESPGANARTQERRHALLDGLANRVVTVSLESQCKFIKVALGEADVAVRFPPRGRASRDWVWDYAGAELIVEEAGARMTDCAGAVLRFGEGRTIAANRGVLCCSAPLHEKLVERLGTMEAPVAT